MFRRGGGGGLKGGRGGIEGEAIPLDTPEPKFQDYFNQVRERIKSKWIYPYEASSRGIEGELQIEFGIAKSGELQFIERRRSSGTEILDDYAMRAVQLASPFPPVPDAISMGGLPINGIFRYHILGSGLINNYLR
jgi:TonB family protein